MHVYTDSSIPYQSLREKSETGINDPLLQKGKRRSREMTSCKWEENEGKGDMRALVQRNFGLYSLVLTETS